MPSKNNKNDTDQLLGILFGAFSIFILVFIIATGNISFLWESSGHGRPGGIPIILFLIPGLVALYYAIKK